MMFRTKEATLEWVCNTEIATDVVRTASTRHSTAVPLRNTLSNGVTIAATFFTVKNAPDAGAKHSVNNVHHDCKAAINVAGVCDENNAL